MRKQQKHHLGSIGNLGSNSLLSRQAFQDVCLEVQNIIRFILAESCDASTHGGREGHPLTAFQTPITALLQDLGYSQVLSSHCNNREGRALLRIKRDSISVLQDKKNSGDWLCNSMNELKTTELYKLK